MGNGNFIYIVLGTNDNFSLFKLDLNEDNSGCPVSLLDPILKINYGERLMGPGIVVFESKVYVFGGNPIPRYPRTPASFENIVKFAVTSVPSSETMIYDILTDTSCTAPPMKSGKFCTFTVTIDEKICVFSKDLKSAPNFELFDTKEISWSYLPELPSTEVKVKAFCVRHSYLFVSTTTTVYCIKVVDPKSGWVKIESWDSCDVFWEKLTSAEKQLVMPSKLEKYGVEKLDSGKKLPSAEERSVKPPNLEKLSVEKLPRLEKLSLEKLSSSEKLSLEKLPSLAKLSLGEKLDSGKSGEKLDIIPFPFEGEGYCVGDICITPYSGFSGLSFKDAFPFYPSLENSPLVQYGADTLMVPLTGDEDDDLPRFAIITTGFKNDDEDYSVPRCPHVTVDVIEVVKKVARQTSHTSNHLLINKLKSLAYSIRYEYNYMFLYHGFSP